MKLKRMVVVLLAVVALMGVCFAAPAIAEEEVKDEHKAQDEESLKDEEPLKDQGIRLCDIVPTECENTDDSQDDDNKNDYNDEDEYPEYCNYPMLVYDPACDQNNQDHNSSADPEAKDPNSPLKDEEPLKDQGIRLCDIVPTECQDSGDSQDEQGHNSGARPEAKDPNPAEEEESKEKEESSAPGAVKAGEEVPGAITKSAPENDDASDPKEAVSASDEIGQIANSGQSANSEANSSPTTYGCPFDYEYKERWDTCLPPYGGFGFYPVLDGTLPGPDSFGGVVALVGHAPADILKGGGASLQVGLDHYVGDALVDYGEDVFSPVGYGIQGLGYTLGFAGEVGGLALSGAGEIVGAVSNGVEVAVDTVVTPVLSVGVEAVEAVVETVEKIGSAAKNIF